MGSVRKIKEICSKNARAEMYFCKPTFVGNSFVYDTKRVVISRTALMTLTSVGSQLYACPKALSPFQRPSDGLLRWEGGVNGA